MNTFTNGLTSAGTIDYAMTLNGGTTLSTSGSTLVDLFFLAGASRGKDISGPLSRAYGDEKELTLRLMLWTRDVRGGAGERQTFRNMLLWLEKTDPTALLRLMSKVPFVGRWDDLLIFETDAIKHVAFDMIKTALVAGDALCAKWMPRKGDLSVELRTYFGWSPKYYRKRLVELTKVVETQMCGKEWNKINYSHVPSVASSRYRKAFAKNDPTGYAKWIGDVQSGTAKVNASAIFPHDVVKNLSNSAAVQIQWDALPNYLEDGRTILPLVDVSGSMSTPVSGGTTAMSVAIAVGMYLSEKQNSAFKDTFLTFTDTPKLMKLSGNIVTRYNQLARAPWGGSTNVEAAFNVVLDHAVKNNVPKEDMPEFLIILSDMEFNAATTSYHNRHAKTSYDQAKSDFTSAGYDLPKVIFWNIAGRENNNPVKFDTNGTALVSGFSPAIVKSVLSGKNVSPLEIVLETLKDSRYDVP